MRIGYYSPMPPAASGVADYSASLLPHLKALGEVEINPSNCDLALYHIGNNSLHREIYQLALQKPGIVVLHDAVLHHLMLGSLTRDQYEEEFVFNYGESSGDLWLNRARSGADPRYFARPMIRRIAETSRAIVVHNPAAAKIVREHAPNARVEEIPHLFIAPPSRMEPMPLEDAFVVGTFGHQRETKRLAVLVRAFHKARAMGANARLIVSGAFVSGTFEAAMAPLLDDPNILRTGHLSASDLWRYAAATGLCVNLRYPSASETSGIAIRMMGIGKPVVFTADESIARYPENACLRVDPGPGEEQMLADYICWLARHCDAAKEIGRRAACHIATHHAPEKIAEQYRDVLNSI